MNLNLGAKQGGGEKTGPQFTIGRKTSPDLGRRRKRPGEMKQQNDLRTQ